MNYNNINMKGIIKCPFCNEYFHTKCLPESEKKIELWYELGGCILCREYIINNKYNIILI